MLERGQRIGEYEVEAHIATGSMGHVYRVRHVARDTRHALKFLPLANQMVRHRMLLEAVNLERLQHPNVVTLTEVIEVDGDPGLVMEYVDGPTLRSWLAKPRSLMELEQVFQGVVRGVAHAHRHGIVHRDLTPLNILLVRTPQSVLPKVADFGLAKAVDPEADLGGLSATDVALGGAAYRAPEQLATPGLVDRRADVFSLGVLLHEMMVGRLPFEGRDPLELANRIRAGRRSPVATIRPDLPHRIVAAIDGCLEPDPDKRIPSCNVLLQVLAEGGAATPVAAPSRGESEDAPSLLETAMFGVMGALIVVALGLAVFLLVGVG